MYIYGFANKSIRRIRNKNAIKWNKQEIRPLELLSGYTAQITDSEIMTCRLPSIMMLFFVFSAATLGNGTATSRL